jgi:hypothetical protein
MGGCEERPARRSGNLAVIPEPIKYNMEPKACYRDSFQFICFVYVVNIFIV